MYKLVICTFSDTRLGHLWRITFLDFKDLVHTVNWIRIWFRNIGLLGPQRLLHYSEFRMETGLGRWKKEGWIWVMWWRNCCLLEACSLIFNFIPKVQQEDNLFLETHAENPLPQITSFLWMCSVDPKYSRKIIVKGRIQELYHPCTESSTLAVLPTCFRTHFRMLVSYL